MDELEVCLEIFIVKFLLIFLNVKIFAETFCGWIPGETQAFMNKLSAESQSNKDKGTMA